MILLLSASLALAGDTSIGVLVGGGLDLPAVAADDPTRFGLGPAVVVPLRIGLSPGAAWRVGVELAYGSGTDRLVWTEYVDGTPYGFYGVEESASYLAGRLLTGPELALAPAALVHPYLGAGGGIGVVRNSHRAEGDLSVLIDADTGGGSPFTLQPAWVAGGWAGVHVGRPGKVALELEAGYAVSFLPEAPLRKSPSALEAARTAWSLDLARLSGGVTFPL